MRLANLGSYHLLISDDLFGDLGVRIYHLNSTAFGGGVAELLSRYLLAF